MKYTVDNILDIQLGDLVGKCIDNYLENGDPYSMVVGKDDVGYFKLTFEIEKDSGETEGPVH